AGVAKIGLQNDGRPFFEDFAKTPFREDAFAGGDGEMGFARDAGHDIDVLALDGFLDEKGLVRFERLDEELRVLGTDGAMKIDGDIDILPAGGAQGGKGLGGVLDKLLIRN